MLAVVASPKGTHRDRRRTLVAVRITHPLRQKRGYRLTVVCACRAFSGGGHSRGCEQRRDPRKVTVSRSPNHCSSTLSLGEWKRILSAVPKRVKWCRSLGSTYAAGCSSAHSSRTIRRSGCVCLRTYLLHTRISCGLGIAFFTAILHSCDRLAPPAPVVYCYSILYCCDRC